MKEFDFYPQKPELIEQKPKSSLSLTVFSAVLFVLIFLTFFGDEFNFIIYLMIVLFIHESGHFSMMKLFKYENVRMLFVPLMGAFVQGKKRNYSQRESFLVIIAGPFPGIVIGAVLMWYANVVHSFWMAQLSALFLLLNVINLLPLDPLDGGQLLKLFAKKRHELFLMIFAFISSIFIIGLGWLLNNYLIIIFGFFMGFRVRGLQKRYQMHKDLHDEHIDYSTTYKLLSNKDFRKIKEVVLEHSPPLRTYLDQVSEDQADPIIASQVNSVLETPLEKDTSLLFRSTVLILWISSFLVPVLLYFTLDLNWLYSVLFI
ncbi:MAG: site-2 protease family protein [Crocinitomicaceae bacterium]|nr:site-2 protease family protein [Crocinitomicaceae bacterium]